MPRDEQAILATFRRELEEDGLIHDGDSIGTDDATLLRFLRARKFNLAQAKVMVLNCQAWRSSVESVGIDELYRRIDPFDYPERAEAFQYWPLWFHQTDKEGRPLNIQSFGSIDMDSLYRTISPDRHWQTVIINADALVREVLPGASQRAGKPIEQVCVIVDLKGFSLGQFWQMKSAAHKSFQVSQDYFPETLGKLVILNAPSTFTMIWSVIRPWLSKETIDKVEILGSNYKEYLLKYIDADMLPASLGGKCSCPGGCDISNTGPWMENRKERREAWLRGEIQRPSDPLPQDASAHTEAVKGTSPSIPSDNGKTLDGDLVADSPIAVEDPTSPLKETSPTAPDPTSTLSIDPSPSGRKEAETVVPPQETDVVITEVEIEQEENPLPGMSRMELSV